MSKFPSFPKIIFSSGKIMCATIILTLAVAAAASSVQVQVPGRCDAPAGQRASCYGTQWIEPPSRVPSGLSTDGTFVEFKILYNNAVTV